MGNEQDTFIQYMIRVQINLGYCHVSLCHEYSNRESSEIQTSFNVHVCAYTHTPLITKVSFANCNLKVKSLIYTVIGSPLAIFQLFTVSATIIDSEFGVFPKFHWKQQYTHLLFHSKFHENRHHLSFIYHCHLTPIISA